MFRRSRTPKQNFELEQKRIRDEIVEKIKEKKLKDNTLMRDEHTKMHRYHITFAKKMMIEYNEETHLNNYHNSMINYHNFGPFINDTLYFLIKEIESFIMIPTKYKYINLSKKLLMPDRGHIKYDILLREYNYETEHKKLMDDLKEFYTKLLYNINELKKKGYDYKTIPDRELIEKIEEYFDLCKRYRGSLPTIRSLVQNDALHVVIRTHGDIHYDKLDQLKKLKIPDNLVIYKLMSSTYGVIHCYRSTISLFGETFTERIIKKLQNNLPYESIKQKNMDNTIRNILIKTKKDMIPSNEKTKKIMKKKYVNNEKIKSKYKSLKLKFNLGESVEKENHNFYKKYQRYKNYSDYSKKIHINRIDKNNKIVYKKYTFDFSDHIFYERGIYLVTKNYSINLLYYLNLDLFFDYDNLEFSIDTEELLIYLNHYCNYISLIDLTCSDQYDTLHSIDKVTKNANIEGNDVMNINAKLQNEPQPKSRFSFFTSTKSQVPTYSEKDQEDLNKLQEISESKNVSNGYPEAKEVNLNDNVQNPLNTSRKNKNRNESGYYAKEVNLNNNI